MNQNWDHQVFCNELALPNHFTITELYNTNREAIYISEMDFLDECFRAGFFDIHKFEINTVLLTETEQRKQRMEIKQLMEYSRENNHVMGSLWNLIQMIKQSGLEVLEVGGSIPWYVRAYVPAWKLMISPSTQNIRGFLQMLTQKDEKICIVTNEGYGEDEKTIAYFINSKPQFYQVYKAFLKEKETVKIKTFLSLY